MGERLVEQFRRVVAALVERPPRQLERDHRLDEALLRAVVQIADDPPALVVDGGGDARAGAASNLVGGEALLLPDRHEMARLIELHRPPRYVRRPGFASQELTVIRWSGW